MKVIIVCQGSYGDVLPFLTIGKILQQQFDVEFVSYSVFKPLAEEAGLKFYGVCTQSQYEEMVSCNKNLTNEDFCYHHFSTCSQYAINPIYEFIVAQHRKGECIIISSLICDGALWASKDYDIPFITILLSPLDIVRRIKLIQKLESGEKILDNDTSRERGIVDSIRKKMGLQAYLRNREELMPEMKLMICLFPYSMIADQLQNIEYKKYRVHFTGFLKEMQKIQKNDQNIVDDVSIVYTCGSAFCASKHELESFGALCESLDVNGLVVSNNYAFECDFFSPRVRLVRNVNMRAVLQNAQLIIHHGGIGTIADAIFTRCPQLIIPRAFDQFSNADMVLNLNIGARYELKDVGDLSLFKATVKDLMDNRQKIQEHIIDSNLDSTDVSILYGLFECLTSASKISKNAALEYI